MAKLTIECTVTVKWWFKFVITGFRVGVFFGLKPSNSFIEKLAINATVVKVSGK